MKSSSDKPFLKSLLKPSISNDNYYKIFIEKKLNYLMFNSRRKPSIKQYCTCPNDLVYCPSKASVVNESTIGKNVKEIGDEKQRPIASPKLGPSETHIENHSALSHLQKLNSKIFGSYLKKKTFLDGTGDKCESDSLSSNTSSLITTSSIDTKQTISKNESKEENSKSEANFKVKLSHHDSSDTSSEIISTSKSSQVNKNKDFHNLTCLERNHTPDINEEIYESFAGPSKFYSRYIQSLCPICKRCSRIDTTVSHDKTCSHKDVDHVESWESALNQGKSHILKNTKSFSLCRSRSETNFSDIEKQGELYKKMKCGPSHDGVSKNVQIFFQKSSTEPVENSKLEHKLPQCKNLVVNDIPCGPCGENSPPLGEINRRNALFICEDTKKIPPGQFSFFPIRDDGIALQKGILMNGQDTGNSVIKFEKRFYVVYNKDRTPEKKFWRTLKNHCFFRFLGHIGT